MDLNDVWQENKRFLTIVAGGVLAFVVGEMVIASSFGDELKAQQRSVAASSRKLSGDPMYAREDLDAARAENEALRAAVGRLSQAVAFRARPEFQVQSGRGSASSQFFNVVATTREALLTLAGRSNLRVPDSVGLPALSPTRDGDIERYLEALDVIDRVVRLAVDAGAERIDHIDIKLDPALASREGVGSLERTRVVVSFSGAAGPLRRLLVATQAAGDGLLIESLEMLPSRSKADDVRLDVTFAIARLSGAAAVDEGAAGEDEG
jgi:hypothetical protein